MTTMPPVFPGYNYPFVNSGFYQQSPKSYHDGVYAIKDKPQQTDLQKLNNTQISSSSNPYLYKMLMHLIDFYTKLYNMRPNLKADSPKKSDSSDFVVCGPITIQITIRQIINPSKQEICFTLSDVLVKLNTIEIYINLLLSNLISSLQHKKQDSIGKNASRCREIREKLIDLSKFVDRILLHYKDQVPDHITHPGIKLPDINEVVQVKNEIYKLLSSVGNSKIQKLLLIEKNTVSFHELLVSLIGLKCEIGVQVEHTQNMFPEHQTDLYYLQNIISKNIDNVLCSSLPSSTVSDSEYYADILEKSGFTFSKASTIATFICERDPDQHQSLAYWVEAYLEFMFKYDIFLNDTCSRFPHNEDKLDKWCTLPTQREGDIDGDKGVSIDVDYINKFTDDVKSFANNDIRFPFATKGNNIWYHGTDHDSAELIRLYGIDVEKGKGKQDFSDGKGFYLTPYFRYANEWASKRGSTKEIKGAVLVFECSLDEFKGIDLFNDDSEWKETIKYYRSGKTKRPSKTLRQRLDRTDYLRGQMSGDGAKYKPDSWEPTRKIGEASQLCIKSEEMADKFSYSLKGIVFFAS